MTIKFAFAAAVAAMACATTASAAEPGFYMGLGGGVSASASSRVVLNRPVNAPATVRTTFAPSWGAIGSLGYQMPSGMRTEVEVGYRQARFLHMNIGTATGHQNVLSGMANVLGDISMGSALGFSFGAGIGTALVKWKQVQATNSATLPGVLPVFDDTSHPVFQYQGIAGVNYAINPTTRVFADYHYVGMTESQFESAALPGANITGNHPTAHNLMVGVRFAFGSK